MSSAALTADPGWQPPTWDEVVDEHSWRVYRWAYRLTGNQHDAEDLTQDVFVRVFRSLSTYRPGSFEGWLHRITTNLFLDGVRKRSRQRTVLLHDDESVQRVVERAVDWDADPARRVEASTLDPDLRAALDDLPTDFREAVLLADVEGLSYTEIAERLGIKMGTVRSRIHRGRRAMRAALEDGHADPVGAQQRRGRR